MTSIIKRKKMTTSSNILGLGIDIIEIERIKDAIEKNGDRFLSRLFSKKEQEYCNQLKNDPSIRFAARFCAKEAVAKALGCGFGKELTFLDIEIQNNQKGKPEVFLSAQANTRFNNPQLHLSLSHCKLFANAVVIWENKTH